MKHLYLDLQPKSKGLSRAAIMGVAVAAFSLGITFGLMFGATKMQQLRDDNNRAAAFMQEGKFCEALETMQ